ncbi:fumarylacetoacetate hydrolase family protein [Rhizobium halophytocola]|uniref:Fumarylpyruvate hydrolase n=1 Tax=Rhizobium halophytocola TaxID=735519 RepID=A0ABS4DTJ0_9HYPH|nr:fumarylacetoacetate hydrolase family protein [Rhizobium halophytocola]MBP1848944.1 fumarylpyruvate hydrolase [Rhizobium halophytocola]
MKALFETPSTPLVPVAGEVDGFPVHRIFCVGRNYAAHAAEMGAEVDREAPFYFTKPASAVVMAGATVPYPPGTSNLHYEMELVVAIGKPAFRVNSADAMQAVYGYACGLDMTRRDLQNVAKEKGRPWDFAKAFENSAILGTISKAEDVAPIVDQRITLSVGGETRQDAVLSDMVWSVPEIISHLSGYYHLQPGDLIYTGTPSGVGAVVTGDELHGTIEGLEPVSLILGPAE